VAPRCPDPAVQKRLEGDLTRSASYERLRTDRELALVRTAQAHEAQPFDRLRSLPGIGQSLARVLLDALHASRRFPRGPDVVSDCRLVTCAKESAGQR
jgi:hypothetical protein